MVGKVYCYSFSSSYQIGITHGESLYWTLDENRREIEYRCFVNRTTVSVKPFDPSVIVHITRIAQAVC